MLKPTKFGLNTLRRFGWRGACRGAYPEYFISFYCFFFRGEHCLYRHHGCLQVKNFQFLKPQRPFKNIFWGATLLTYITQQLTSFTKKNYLEWVKARINDSKFAIDKYPINTVEIIKLFPVQVFMSASNFPWLAILWFYKKEVLSDLLSIQEVTQGNQHQ